MVWLLQNATSFFVTKKQQPFKDFLDFVTENRRRGEKSLSVIAETSKLIGNSAYGIQLISKSKFQNTLFVDEKKLIKNQFSEIPDLLHCG